MGLELGESRNQVDPAGFFRIFPLRWSFGRQGSAVSRVSCSSAPLRPRRKRRWSMRISAASGFVPSPYDFWISQSFDSMFFHVFFPMKLAMLRQFWAKITEGGRNILQVGAFSWRNFLGCHGMPVPPFSIPTQRKVAEMHRYPLHFSWDFLGLLELETAKEVHHPSEGCASASCGTGSVEFGCDGCWFA